MHRNIWYAPKKEDTMSFFRKKKIISTNVENDDIDDDENISDEMKILRTLEIAAKSTKLDTKEIISLLKTVISNAPTISELKSEIIGLKKELKEQKEFNNNLILKLIDKPAPVSAATAHYLANKGATAANSSTGSATAGPKGKLP